MLNTGQAFCAFLDISDIVIMVHLHLTIKSGALGLQSKA
jgi:hypothetical protein